MKEKQLELEPLDREFFKRSTLEVAQRLLNTLLVRREASGEQLVGRICEVEAYTCDDPASHSYRGPTRRNGWMFGPPGCAYVYRIYGVHYCFNVVTAEEGVGEAVLVRSVQPLLGLELMGYRRRLTAEWAEGKSPKALLKLHRALCAGPGRLCEAFGIELAHCGLDLTCPLSALFLAKPWEPASWQGPLVASERIGVAAGKERLWRFTLGGDPYVSCPLKRARK